MRAFNLCMAALLLTASAAIAQQAPGTSSTPGSQPGQTGGAAQSATGAPAKKGPAPKTQEEFNAYKAAASKTDPAQLEAAANDFAQKFPESELRPFLYQQAMGMYQQTGNADKALEMARSTLKYDPNNAVALLTASQMLAERTHDSDLDKDDRLNEAQTDASKALQHTAEIQQPPSMTPEQFQAALGQLRGTAHEVMGTVALKKTDYPTAVKEYSAAIDEQKEHTDATLYLRLAVANDKAGNVKDAQTAVQKAIAAAQPGSQVQQLAQQEKARLDKLAGSSAPTATPGAVANPTATPTPTTPTTSTNPK